MAENTLTGLIPDLYEAMDIVSRELVGFIPAVTMNASAERAAVGEAVKTSVAPDGNLTDVTPAMQVPEPTGQTIGNRSITITKSKASEFGFTGEAQRGLNNGAGYANVRAGMIAQSLRKLINAVETDMSALYMQTSRAWGSAGTTPFGSDLGETAQVNKILLDNGAPPADNQLVINTTAGANLRTLANLNDVSSSNDQTLLRQGVLLPIHGFDIRESAQVASHTKGTGSGYTTDTAGYAVGATEITLITGSGTVLAGDVVTFAGDTNKYIVTTGAAAAGAITIAEPGLRIAIPTSATAMTVGNSYTANMAFARSALHLVTRAPALPEEGDSASDRQLITDPRSGLTVEAAIYTGYKKVRYELALAWGMQNMKPEHTAMLLG